MGQERQLFRGSSSTSGAIRALFALVAVAAISVAVAACGSSDDTSSDSGSTSTGGEATLAQTSQPDFLDPALSYTVNGWEPMWIVYTPLYTYPHEEGPAGSEVAGRAAPATSKPHAAAATRAARNVIRREPFIVAAPF